MGPIPDDPTDAEAVQRNILGTLRFQHNCILRWVQEWRAKAPDFGIVLSVLSVPVSGKVLFFGGECTCCLYSESFFWSRCCWSSRKYSLLLCTTYLIGLWWTITTHFCGETTACFGVDFTRTIRLSSFSVSSIPPAKRKSEGGPPCNSMPLGARSGVLYLRA